ncbi:MAG: glycogen/starch synthase, partial [Clostridia bacterium]
VPVYLDIYYRGAKECKNAKTVFTIHNIEFQGKYGNGIITDVLGLPLAKKAIVEYDDCVNFMKGGIECANAVTTVSPTYSNEILNAFYGYGMQDILSKRKFKLTGIINGIDQSFNDPSSDKAIFKNYTLATIEDKRVNKRKMQEMLDLPRREEAPLVGMVGRLTHQKGFDLLTKCMEKILSMDVQVVILGTGDWQYESYLKDLQTRFAGKLRCIINFSSDMASKIYAASDMFLMPSKFEPCGLSQMIAMRYGSIPIVRETGGLKDTVEPFNPTLFTGTGFTFFEYNERELMRAIERAVDLYYNNKIAWIKLMKNAMSKDFGWDNIAKKYLELYNKI